ncbi:MAG: galactofuranose transport system ATP-binding protein, partial [Pseudonocardiales bacterium]|nr:galactofuranose transport system ATP-binding protein [Pseudonocardiales bacterium]
LEEVVRIADRIVVLRDRHKIAELDGGSSIDEVVGLIAGEQLPEEVAS